MPRSLCLVDGHVDRLAGSSRGNFIAAVRGLYTSRDHASLDLVVRSSSHRKHTCFHGTGVPSGSLRHLRVEIRMGAAHICFRAPDGFLRGAIPRKSSASSILGYRKCSSVYGVYSGVSCRPASVRKRQFLFLLLGSEFCWRVDTAGDKSACLQVC